LILGASARAAAMSAGNAGFAPMTVDLFADRDLADRFPAHRVDRDGYPANLASIAEALPDAPWIYTGGLENHPALIERIARRRPLLGIVGESLRAVRNPSDWIEALRSAGLPVLESRVAGDPPPSSGDWLLKPLASASGHGIRRWNLGEGSIPDGSQIQARLEGLSLGATFLGNGQTARLVGVTRQLLGRSTDALRVIYRGSIGPWPLANEVETAVARIGTGLMSAFALRGLFGVDLIVQGRTPWPVEINPRYSASVEVLEAALGLTLLADHARMFDIEVDRQRSSEPHRPIFAAKQILFARKSGKSPRHWPWTDPAMCHPRVADLPRPATPFDAGDPILTVMARGQTLQATAERLKARAAIWRRRIDAWASP